MAFRTRLFLALVPVLSVVASAQDLPRPKLVVGIVVDQMRPDYLYRFYNRFGTGGFKRMMTEGFVCEDTFIPFTPTYTAPGHACVYTGSVPALNGIVGNNWYDKEKRRTVYCTDDDSAQTVGSASAAGKMSPRNMWSTTVGDELRLATNFRSKTIGIALKDRGAILPAGHSANAAYWFDNATGGWISSTHYGTALPVWVQAFNDKNLPDQYLAKGWNTLYPIQTYTHSTEDNRPWEGTLPGGGRSFPHRTDTILNNRFETFRFTPGGNSFTLEMAKAAVENEALGTRGVTDMLAVSFSSPDYIGHAFGPNSVEIEDCYLRLDKDLAAFFTYLDGKVGRGQYTVFLTADHAVAHIPGFAKENRLPGGLISSTALRQQVEDTLRKTFGGGPFILNVINHQLHLDDAAIASAKADRAAMRRLIVQTILRKQSGIAQVLDWEATANAGLPAAELAMLTNGHNQRLSGELEFIPKPGWFEGGPTGTTHGSWNAYDAHIPLLWMGWGIKSGRSTREVYMSDIAPTVAALLHIQMPSASVGKVIGEVIK